MKIKTTILIKLFVFLCFCWQSNLLFGFDTTSVMITEFLAVNSSIIGDEDGDSTDWIELYNPTDAPINLKGWFISDDVTEPYKWKFPDVTIDAKEYMVIFASSKNKVDSSSTLHTNFKLSSGGENIILTKANMQDVVFAFPTNYPLQFKDISYGIIGDEFVYMNEPTPGAPNIAGTFLPPPIFSIERGFYNNSFNVELSSAVSGCTIRYTTDGSAPTIDNGQVYATPIPINTTTPLRAVAYKPGCDTSDVITHTYFFLDSVIRQDNHPDGYPSQFGYITFSNDRISADYEMDPQIVNSSAYKDLMDSSLLSIPTLSIVTDIPNLFADDTNEATGGIYIYTGSPLTNIPEISARGYGWERPASIEYIVPNSSRGFQVNCGLRLHGGHSRRPEKDPKHSFRLVFKTEYGPGKLNYNLFRGEDGAARKFNSLVCRGGFNNTWLHSGGDQRTDAQYIQDSWMKDSHRAMGWHSPYNTFVHLYLNGLYWGVYNISEKPNEDYMETYFGSDADDYDVIKDFGYVLSGYGNVWDTMIAMVQDTMALDTVYQRFLGNNPDGTVNPAYEPLMNAVSFVDYMLLNFYGGNDDWDRHNWVSARNRVNPGKGFEMVVWDAEHNLESIYRNNLGVYDTDSRKCPSNIFQPLRLAEEFNILLADRIQMHCFNNGALTPAATANRYQKRVDEVEMAMIGESARWGDYRRSTPYTLEDWRNKKNYLMNTFFPQRTKYLLTLLKNYSMYPSIDAPVFSQHGGIIDTFDRVSITASLGDIYFTVDGSDPRLFGGGISPTAMLYSDSIQIDSNMIIKARAFDDAIWSAITVAEFKVGDAPTGIQPILATPTLIEKHVSYPNPFNDYTSISYYLPESGKVDVYIFSIDGRMITKLYSGHQMEGVNEVIWEPQGIQDGIFLYRISTNSGAVTGKMMYRK
ncbi:MAG: chitobiase/beta-hexosaminidase C-terminal domain-containing protein [Bacteroidales bacterium]|nr:chitobiase/beta-hexosaminidase C-terminal domain-containing protein [Bacteroidales bacterium]